ncbi:hypothetical protein UlMin_004604 [Ulmus minor]
MEVAHQIAQLLRDTLYPDCGAVSATNKALNRLYLLSDFPFALLFLALEAGDEGQKIATATYLKNFTRRNIDDAHQPSKVSKEFKDKLFLVLLQAQPPVLKVLVEVYFLDPKVAQEPVPLQLELIAKEILVPVLTIFHQYVEKVDFKITGTREAEVEKTLLMVCKCMYFAVRSYMPSVLAPLLSTFCHDLIGILGSLSFNHAVYLENECLMRLKTGKRSLQIFCVLVTRHQKYLDKLMLNIINYILHKVKYSKIIKRIVLLAFDVISCALETGLGWSLVSPHFSSLLDYAIFPALVMNEKYTIHSLFLLLSLGTSIIYTGRSSGWRDDLFTTRKSAINLLGGPPIRAACNGSSASSKRKKGERNKGSQRSSMGELLVLPFLSKFPIPFEPNPTQSVLNNYFGVLMAYGFMREQEPRYTILVQLHLLPLYKSSVSLPYLIGLANCLPEEMSADIYSLLLNALTMADGDISLLSKAVTSGPSHPKSDQHEFLESQERSGYVFGVHLKKKVLQGTYPVSTLYSYVSFHVCFNNFSGLFPKLICNLYEKAKSGKFTNLCIIYVDILIWKNMTLRKYCGSFYIRFHNRDHKYLARVNFLSHAVEGLVHRAHMVLGVW